MAGPLGADGFVAAQTVGALAAAGVIRWLFAPDPADAHQVVVPYDSERPLAVPAGRPSR